jgi:hypothetical protein
MQTFDKLEIWQQKEILNGLFFDGLSFDQISKKYNIEALELKNIIDKKALNPYHAQFAERHQDDEETHKKTIWTWIKNSAMVGFVCYLFVVLLQSSLGGFESQITTDSIAYITQPVSKIVNLSLGIGFIVFCLYQFFPILATLINEKVNTISLKSVFMEAPAEAKLKFLSQIVLALCLLVGLVFSAKAQENKRECILKTATAEIGTIENGVNNKGHKIDIYRSVVLNKTVKGYNDPWCAYFIAYIFKICGVNTPNYSPRARDWFQDSKRIVWRRNFQYSVIKQKPQPGDLIGYVFRSGTIGHIEILDEWHDDYFYSIGGNTSTAKNVYRDADKNDGVWRKKRPVEMAYIIANHVDEI